MVKAKKAAENYGKACGNATKKEIHGVDQLVGRRLRLRRNIIGMSQESLAKKIGVSFQQVQKYERGTNRISASRLYNISTVLGVPVNFFFHDLLTEDSPKKSGKIADRTECLNSSEALELVKHFCNLSTTSRKNLIELLKVIV